MKRRSGFKIMARLIVLVRPLAGYMTAAIAMGLAGNLCASFITIFGALAVLAILGFEGVPPLAVIFICAGAFALFRAGLRYGEQSCNHFIAFKLLALIRDRVFKALRRLCPAKLEGRDRGDLISVITSDIELLEVFYAHTISPAAIWALLTAVMCIFIGSYHPFLGLLALAAYLIVGVVVPLVTAKIGGDDGLKFRNKSGELSGFVMDSLRGIYEIIQYGRGKARLAEMNRKTDALSRDEKEMKRKSSLSAAVTDVVVLLLDIGMLCAGAALYLNGAVGFEGVLVPTVALFSSFGPSIALANLGSTLQNTLASGNRVLDILDETPVTEEVFGKPVVEFSVAAAENVGFSYGGEPVLNNVSLNVPQGKIIGIVGKSGCGKSTLLKLFMRFWNVESGSIKISGTDVSNVNTDNLRAVQSLFTQETALFHDSIKNNLRIAKLDATDGEIIAACKKASVHDFIVSLKEGYDTPVGELGSTLSAGERQRIGLARAFLNDAPFMLLDEPTGSLDSLNEAVILKALDEQRTGKTVLLVSHRTSTVGIADEVYQVRRTL